MSTSIDPLVAVNGPLERRFYPRVTPSLPIYVAFGPSNLGTLLNVSENGFQVVTPDRLDVNSVYRVFLSLDGVSSTITVSVRTVWTAESDNGSGIQFLDLSEQDRQQIRTWVALRTSQNRNTDHWFSPEQAAPSVAAHETVEPPPPPAAEPPPVVTEPSSKPDFPPMPLPIHGEFTYEPPSGREKKTLHRRERKSRRRSRSAISAFVLWTLVVLMICLGAGWPFRHQLSERLLHRPRLAADETAQPTAASSSLAGLDAVTPPAVTEIPESTDANGNGDNPKSNPTKDPGHDEGATSVTSAPAASSKVVQPAAVPTRPPRHLAPTTSASKPNLGSLPDQSAAPEAPEVSRSYVPDAASALAPANDPSSTRAAPNTTEVANASSASEPRTSTPPPPPATIRPAINAPAAGKSAIVGSIGTSPRAGSFSADRPSDYSAASAPPATPQPSTSRANSFVARNSNPGSSAPANYSSVIQMDVSEARVIEVTPPRTLTGNLTSSIVNLPGERVLRSGPLTMHIERSVRIPGDRIPGQRWLWRGHKKVVLGELASRVDPQVSQLPPYGSITVLATIDKDGYVSNVKPLHGSMALLPNVAGAVHSWRYQPTYLDNKPVETQAQIEIDVHTATSRVSKP
jgi:hypothetical protein